ncbi:hypothetical protein M2132_001806 [Dysgonomonas sp. PH5-45]|uniref:hypothetical protein n=1 Tax=unclassified Dysgonomonas TaxID=2630389 RepID=UPI00247649B3|nr:MULTISPECIES: hypothetical protein [unclassified Dysgonomonas]MDH6355463.1 hypothetical protein [Dysgonomonas sp. PH5-45]MDH6388359.1 hypothetical protein [Dysgonomonas sp. PH5-37]
MSAVITKIGNIEITPGVAEFLETMLHYDIDRYAVSVRLSDLARVQDFITRVLLDLTDPDPNEAKQCLSSIMYLRDQLSLLVADHKEGGAL